MALVGAGVEQPQSDVAAAQRDIRAQRRAAVLGPAAPAGREFRQQRLDVLADQALGVQQQLRLRVVLHDAAVAVEHEDAIVHVALHELVDAHLRGELAAALGGKALVRRDAAREPARHTARGKGAHGEHPGLYEARDRRVMAEHPVGLLEEKRDRGKRRVEEAQAPRRHDRRADERHDEHHAQAASHAAARVHEKRNGEHVDAGVHRELHVEVAAHLAQHRVQDNGGGEIGNAGVAEELERMRAERERVAIDERQREEQRRERHPVKVEIAERDPERFRRALRRREEELGVALRCLHQRRGSGPSRACSSLQ